MPSETPALLWTPSTEQTVRCGFADYLAWLRRERGRSFDGYREAWHWSVTEIEEFWESLWEYFEIDANRPYDRVLSTRAMPGARWFEGAALNYADHAFRRASSERPAILFQSERAPLRSIEWDELRRDVASIAAWLRRVGIEPGDRVAAYMPNIPETVVLFLACASVGAVWSCCSPDFGSQSAIERFRQIDPRVIVAVDGYAYGGKEFDRRMVVRELVAELPSLGACALVPYLDHSSHIDGMESWSELLEHDEELRFESLPFEHPLWILYSSGTTGAPKAIVHGHGGILLEHLKMLRLQSDVRRGDRLLWYTTTGWMMWNRLVGGLLAGATIVLYDGSPAFPRLDVLWQLVERAEITHFGGGAGFYMACMEAGLAPRDRFDLQSLRSISSTGSPLPPEGYRWIYSAVKEDVWLVSSSGGTDLATAFLGACPMLPVYEGELQGAALGASVHAFDETGAPVIDEVGELVITEPMPSMPLYFWNDPDGVRYRESYFDLYPGVWRHGDWVRFTNRGSAVILGRSDSTLNRHGVRIGTAEIYRAVESLPEIADSLVIGLERPGGGYYMPLFVVLRDDATLDEALKRRIREHLRTTFTPRHVPDEILQIAEVPRTLNGKKVEVPVKKILLGIPLDRAVNPGALRNPESLHYFVEMGERLRGS